MNTPIETPALNQPAAPRTAARPAKAKSRTYLFLLMGWILLIAVGVLGAKLYSEYMMRTVTEQIALQTEQQLQAVKADYESQMKQLKESVTGDMSKLQTKVDSLNELLAFTKDSANSKTDNSNQLYTQLADVKKKLDDLKKSLEVLQ
jgi:septal ring factor EnvC (AmiA/AmiB activator)